MANAENKSQSEFGLLAKVKWQSCFSKLLQKSFFKISLLLIATAFIAIGISRGENTLVLQKAVRICMECIGLG
ncbi:MAG: hypothetical protein K2J68_06080 [Treponemataceae bacterium]|nr:hypothetical protein [Treponemataceae bacterium]